MLTKSILVYGARKSGTTLVQSLLDGVPEILMTPGELKLKHMCHFESSPMPETWARFLANGRSIWLRSKAIEPKPSTEGPAVFLLHPDQLVIGALKPEQIASAVDVSKYLETLTSGTTSKEIKNLSDLYQWDVQSLIGAMKQPSPWLYWGCKEVGGNVSVVISHFRTWCPGSKIIFVVRDPFFTIRSSVRFKRRKGRNLSIAKVWEQCHEIIAANRYGLSLRSADSHVIHYERLIANPEKEMRDVAAFLGIPWTPMLLTPSTLGVPSRVSTASQNKISIFDSNIHDWRDDLTFLQVLTIGIYFRLHKVPRGAIG